MRNRGMIEREERREREREKERERNGNTRIATACVLCTVVVYSMHLISKNAVVYTRRRSGPRSPKGLINQTSLCLYIDCMPHIVSSLETKPSFIHRFIKKNKIKIGKILVNVTF